MAPRRRVYKKAPSTKGPLKESEAVTNQAEPRMPCRFPRPVRLATCLPLVVEGSYIVTESFPDSVAPAQLLTAEQTQKSPGWRGFSNPSLEEREGFEPSVRFRTPDFESGTFDHSATSPVSSTNSSRLKRPYDVHVDSRGTSTVSPPM